MSAPQLPHCTAPHRPNACRALFAPSCYYAYGMDSHENAHILTVTLVTYAAAQQVLTAPNRCAIRVWRVHMEHLG